MAFPTSIDSYTTKVDGVDYPSAAHINSLQTAVVALETKVGINSSSDVTSLDYLKNLLYPVGTVYTNYSVSTNPGTLFGFGTWVAIEGEVVVGYKSGDADFGTPSGASGAKTSAHTHTGPSHTHTGPSHTHAISITSGNVSATEGAEGGSGTVANSSHTHLVSGTSGAGGTGATGAGGTGASGSTASSTLQPARTCYVWRRSA